MRRIAILSAVVFFGALAAPAISDDVKLGTVTGRITFAGKALPAGTVSFHTENAKISSPIGADGSYKVEKVPVGTVRVSIETESVKPKDGVKPPKDVTDPAEKKNAPRPEEKPAGYVPIPIKFAKPDTSGLTFEVKNGRQEFNIDLKE